MYCNNCGKEIADEAVICVHCGVPIKRNFQHQSEKKWAVTLLLAFFLGSIGAHRFYTGHTVSAVIMLILTCTIFGWFISEFWALIDFIVILCGNFKTHDGERLT